MASFDLNKPAAGGWKTPADVGANPGKTVPKQPGGAKMATAKPSISEAGMKRNDKSQSTASNIDQPMLPLELLLLMYRAGNLPFHFAGSMPAPIGLFAQFGLPRHPMPIIPQSSPASTTGIDRTAPNSRQKAIDLAEIERSSGGTNMRAVPQTSNVGHKTGRLHTSASNQSGRSKTLKSPSGVVPNVRNAPYKLSVNGFSAPINRNAIPSAQGTSIGQRSTGVASCEVARPAAVIKHVDRRVEAKVINAESRSKVSANKPTARTSLTHVRPNGSIENAEVNSGLSTGAGSSSTQKQTSFCDAEAAAWLLRLSGRNHSDSPAISSLGRSVNTTPAPTTSRSRNNISRQEFSERTRSESSVCRHNEPEQAVDLSTKSKLKSQDVRRMSPAHPLNNNTLRKLHSNPHELHGTSLNIAGSNTQKGVKTMQMVTTTVSDPVNLKPQHRHIVPSQRTKVDSTSVVSHLPSCICAFDSPANVEGGANSSGQEKIVHGQQTNQPHISGFKFKKVICEKFSQSSSTTSTVYKDVIRTGGDNKLNRDGVIPRAPVEVASRSKGAENLTKGRERPPIYGNGGAVVTSRIVAPSGEIDKTHEPRNEKVHLKAARPQKPPQPVQTSGSQSSQRVSKELLTSTKNSLMSAVGANVTNSGQVGVPSFSELRQKSVELQPKALKDVSQGVSKSDRDSEYRTKLPTSNLYRTRHSELGGSNDSLHSIRSDADPAKPNSGDESDSSCSSSDSDASNSDESDCESENETVGVSNATKPQDESTKGAQIPPPPSPRSRFVLSRPKFTLNSPEGSPPVLATMGSPTASVAQDAASGTKLTSSPGSKIKMKMPTFTFSSNGDKTPSNDSKTFKGKEIATKIPELKCDAGDEQDSFKYKLIEALAKPGSKDGVAVHGKSLRELVGEANCFYHNNRKYVLKRVLKSKPKSDLVSDVDNHKTVTTSKKSFRKVGQGVRTCTEQISPPKIEPRISVTAHKRPENMEIPGVKKAKKLKRHRRHHEEFANEKKLLSDETRTRVNVDVKSAKHSVPHNKRRRRIHEIDNLVFEGAGGLTPIPDLSLRDSDVFSNIKLRRREAAKRGIAETSTPRKSKKLSRKSALKTTKWIKKQAHNRAIANKNRKRSIEKRLRKYKTKNRLLIVKKESKLMEIQPRASCVRINAGVARPHLDIQSYTGDEGIEAREKSITGQAESRQNDAGVCIVTPEGKQTLDAQAQASFTSHGASAEYNGRPNCVSTKSKADTRDASNIADQVEPQNQTNRRISKRLSERKQSVDNSHETSKNEEEINACDSDSVRSDSPFCAPNRGQHSRRKRKLTSTKARASPCLSKSNKTTRSDSKHNFSLLSCFSSPSAITLAAAFGDLRPSYSVKNTEKIKNSPNMWRTGSSALDTKQQLQREMWRNMTLDMFHNGNGLSVNNIPA